jgi:hypothetical protein
MLTITIPSPVDDNTFVDIDVSYDVIATAGPPEPPLDTVLTGWKFIECWRVFPEKSFAIQYLEMDGSDYTDYIDQYVSDNFRQIQATCRDFELTRPETVV